MSKVFSLVGLETNTGIRDAGIMSGIPEVEDIQNSDLYKELVEDCGCSDYITTDRINDAQKIGNIAGCA